MESKVPFFKDRIWNSKFVRHLQITCQSLRIGCFENQKIFQFWNRKFYENQILNQIIANSNYIETFSRTDFWILTENHAIKTNTLEWPFKIFGRYYPHFYFIDHSISYFIRLFELTACLLYWAVFLKCGRHVHLFIINLMGTIIGWFTTMNRPIIVTIAIWYEIEKNEFTFQQE